MTIKENLLKDFMEISKGYTYAEREKHFENIDKLSDKIESLREKLHRESDKGNDTEELESKINDYTEKLAGSETVVEMYNHLDNLSESITELHSKLEDTNTTEYERQHIKIDIGSLVKEYNTVNDKLPAAIRNTAIINTISPIFAVVRVAQFLKDPSIKGLIKVINSIERAVPFRESGESISSAGKSVWEDYREKTFEFFIGKADEVFGEWGSLCKDDTFKYDFSQFNNFQGYLNGNINNFLSLGFGVDRDNFEDFKSSDTYSSICDACEKYESTINSDFEQGVDHISFESYRELASYIKDNPEVVDSLYDIARSEKEAEIDALKEDVKIDFEKIGDKESSGAIKGLYSDIKKINEDIKEAKDDIRKHSPDSKESVSDSIEKLKELNECRRDCKDTIIEVFGKSIGLSDKEIEDFKEKDAHLDDLKKGLRGFSFGERDGDSWRDDKWSQGYRNSGFINKEYIKSNAQKVEDFGKRNVSSLNTTVDKAYNEIRGDLRHFVGKIVEVGDTEKIKQLKQYLEDKRELVLAEKDKEGSLRGSSEDLIISKSVDLLSSVIKQIDEGISARETDSESDEERAEKKESDNNQNKEDANDEKEKIKDQEAEAEKTSDIKEADSEHKLEDASPDNQEDNSPDNKEDNSSDNKEDASPDNKEDTSPDNKEDNSPNNKEDNSPDNKEDNSPDNKEDNSSDNKEDSQQQEEQEGEQEEEQEEGEDEEEEESNGDTEEPSEETEKKAEGEDDKSKNSDNDYDEEDTKGQNKEKDKGDGCKSDSEENPQPDISIEGGDSEEGLLAAVISSFGGGGDVNDTEVATAEPSSDTGNPNDNGDNANGDGTNGDLANTPQDNNDEDLLGTPDDNTAPQGDDNGLNPNDNEPESDVTVPEGDISLGDDSAVLEGGNIDDLAISTSDDSIPEGDMSIPDDVVIADPNADLQSSDIISPEDADANADLAVVSPDVMLEDGDNPLGDSFIALPESTDIPEVPIGNIEPSPADTNTPDNEEKGDNPQDKSLFEKYQDFRSTLNEINETLRPFKMGAEVITGGSDATLNILKNVINTAIAVAVSSATGIPVWLAKPLVEIAETAALIAGCIIVGAITSIFDPDSDFWSNVGESIKDFFTGIFKPVSVLDGISESDLATICPDCIPEYSSFFDSIKENIADITIDTMFTTENDIEIGDYDFGEAQETLRGLCGYDMSTEKFLENLDSSPKATFVFGSTASSFELGDIVKGTSLDPKGFDPLDYEKEQSRYSDADNQPHLDANVENVLDIASKNSDFDCVFDSVCFDYTDPDLSIDLVDSVDFYISEFFDYTTLTSFYMAAQDGFYGSESLEAIIDDAKDEEFRNFVDNIDNPNVIGDVFGDDETAKMMADTFEKNIFASGTDMANTFNNLLDRIENDADTQLQLEYEKRDRENGIEPGMTFREIERAQQELREAEALKEHINARKEESEDKANSSGDNKEDMDKKESDNHEPDRKESDNEKIPDRRENDSRRDTDSHEREDDTSSRQSYSHQESDDSSIDSYKAESDTNSSPDSDTNSHQDLDSHNKESDLSSKQPAFQQRGDDSNQYRKEADTEKQPEWKIDYSRRGSDNYDRESDTSSSKQSPYQQKHYASDDSSSTPDR